MHPYTVIHVQVSAPLHCYTCAGGGQMLKNWGKAEHRSASATAVTAGDKLPQLPPCCRHCHRATAAAKLLLLPPPPRRTGTAALPPLLLPPQTSYRNCHHAAATAAVLLPPPNINVGLCVHQFLSTQIIIDTILHYNIFYTILHYFTLILHYLTLSYTILHYSGDTKPYNFWHHQHLTSCHI